MDDNYYGTIVPSHIVKKDAMFQVEVMRDLQAIDGSSVETPKAMSRSAVRRAKRKLAKGGMLTEAQAVALQHRETLKEKRAIWTEIAKLRGAAVRRDMRIKARCLEWRIRPDLTSRLYVRTQKLHEMFARGQIAVSGVRDFTGFSRDRNVERGFREVQSKVNRERAFSWPSF